MNQSNSGTHFSSVRTGIAAQHDAHIDLNPLFQLHTLLTRCGHLYRSAAHRSLRAIWHSYRRASAQSSNSKVNAKRGFWAVAGQRRARAIVTAMGSQSQHESRIVCSTPMQQNSIQSLIITQYCSRYCHE